MRSTVFITLALVALLSACGSDTSSDASTKPFSSEVAALDGDLDSVEQALSIHAGIIANAPDMTAVMVEEDAFLHTMMNHMDGISSSVSHMGMCTDGSGNHHAMGDMEGHMNGMSENRQTHHDQMQASANLDAAHAEEMIHQQTMQAHIDALRADADSMMQGGMMEGGMMGHGNDMTCPAH